MKNKLLLSTALVLCMSVPAMAQDIEEKQVVANGQTAVFENGTAENLSSTGNGGVIENSGETSVDNFNFTSNEASQNGGALFNNGALDVTGASSFEGNSAPQGGAVSNYGTGAELTIGDNATFKNNSATVSAGGAISTVDTGEGKTVIGNNALFEGNTSAMQGGAVHNQRATTNIGSDAKFYGNKALGYGGGAVYQDTDGVETNLTIGDNAEFKNNSTDSSHGGAIMNFNANEGANLVLGKNALFESNTAAKTGGAVSNWAGGVEVGEGAKFTNNTAATDGGAVYNSAYGSTAELKLNGSTFTGNMANGLGGALYNDGTLTLNGDNVFSQNTDSTGANDIHNIGDINVAGGALSLDGGISGDGSLTFADGTSLNVMAGKTQIANNVTNNGAKLNLIIDNGMLGNYDLITGSINQEFELADNNLFDVTSSGRDGGSYTIERKSKKDIIHTTGADENQARAIRAIMEGPSEDERFNNVTGDIVHLLQEKESVKDGLKAVSTMSPEDAPVVRTTQTEVVDLVFDAVSSRMTNGSIRGRQGKSSGDLTEDMGVWVQGLINKSKLDGHFRTRTNGVAGGLETEVNDKVKMGLGYAFGKTHIKSNTRKTELKSNTAFIYGEYQPDEWFVNGIAGYTWSKYKEKKNVLGTSANGNYDVNAFSLQAITGYEYQYDTYKSVPHIGLRYVNIHQDSYKDGLGTRVSSENNNILTAMAGITFEKDIYLGNCTLVTPAVRFGVTYDIMREDDNASVTLANNAVYSVKGQNLKRFGYEIGAGLTTEYNDSLEMNVGYEGKFRNHYQNHTGLLNLKYKF